MDDEAPGWDAIEAAIVTRVAPEGEPLHWATGFLPDQDGAYGISAYRAADVWLFVTFGLTELFKKGSDDPTTSGWGFELTMRTPRLPDQANPPTWPLTLLRSLSSYVFRQASPFAAGHRLDPGGPITGKPDTNLTALAFTEDRQLPPIDTPNGRVEFLQVVGITAGELASMKAATTADVLRELERGNPLLATHAAR